MGDSDNQRVDEARRSFILNSSIALGSLSLMGGLPVVSAAVGSEEQGILGAPHFEAKAKRVIFLHMLGAISHVDTFDYKPTLERMHGEELPASVRESQRISTMSSGQGAFPIVGPLKEFQQHGDSGAWVSGFLPHIGSISDDLCFIKSMNTEHVNHDPATKFLHSGYHLAGRPSNGAWLSYGLGTDNNSLPNYVVMRSGPAQGTPLDNSAWSSGFLPSHFQGVEFRAADDPVLYVNNPEGIDSQDRLDMIAAISKLAESQYAVSKDPEIQSRLNQYEMAYRMQHSVPEVADISDEPEYILEMYGPDVRKPGTFARNCLIARRLAERNVKFTTLFGMGWDHHFFIQSSLPERCLEIDQPAAALVKDLKQRGLLEDTLVVFGSEFGRTPFSQGDIKSPGFGRDHHGGAFTWWLAGGGVKAGYSHGETDEFAYNIVKDPVHIHDLNATLMRLLGIDHKRLTFRFQGRDFRLTDVHGHVVNDILS